MKLLDCELVFPLKEERGELLFCLVYVNGCPRVVEETKRTIQLTLPTTHVN